MDRFRFSNLDQKEQQEELAPTTKRRLLISTATSLSSSSIISTSSNRKRWSITSIHNNNNNNNSNSNSGSGSNSSSGSSKLTSKRQSSIIRTSLRNNTIEFSDSKKLSLVETGDLGSLECRLGAQSAPALLSPSSTLHHRLQKEKDFLPILSSMQSDYNSNIDDNNDDCNIEPIRENHDDRLTIKTNSKNQKMLNDKQSSSASATTIKEPIVQLKESSSSSQSLSSASSTSSASSQESDSEITTTTAIATPCDKLVTNDEISNENSADGSADSGDQVSHSSRHSRSIVKRRLIHRTRQTKQQSSSSRQVSNSAEINDETNHIELQPSNNNNNINSFFRTRQIGGYQTSSSKTSIKTHTSSSKSLHHKTSSTSSAFKSNTSKLSKIEADNNNNNINNENNNINSPLSTSLSKSASKRHIEQLIETSSKASEIMTTNNTMTNTHQQNRDRFTSFLPSSPTRASPDLSQSSFPFEIERVLPNESSSLGATSTTSSHSHSQMTEAAVSHRESFSTSTSLRNSAAIAANAANTIATENHHIETKQHQQQQQQHHHQLATSNSLTSNSSMASTVKAATAVAAAASTASAASSTISSSSTTSSSLLNGKLTPSTTTTNHNNNNLMSGHQRNRLFSTSSHSHMQSHHHQETMSSARTLTTNGALSQTNLQANPFQIFVTSPDVRSLAQEIGTDFAKLESCLTTRADNHYQNNIHNQHHHNLIGNNSIFQPRQRQFQFNQQAFMGSDNNNLLFDRNVQDRCFAINNRPLPLPGLPNNISAIEEQINEHERIKPLQLTNAIENANSNINSSANIGLDSIGRTNRIRELLNKANNPNFSSTTTSSLSPLANNNLSNEDMTDNNNDDKQQSSAALQSSEAMNESITRIEHKLSDICKKLDSCQDLKQAIELLEVLIQMIEKAWSVPVCGDDLGFRLCSSLRLSGGLSFILVLIFDAQQISLSFLSNKQTSANDEADDSNNIAYKQQQQQHSNNNRNQLRLSLPNSQHTFEETITLPAPPDGSTGNNSPGQSPPIITTNPDKLANFTIGQLQNQAKDSDSETILTSDLGLDSASVESFSYANNTNNNKHQIEDIKANNNNNGDNDGKSQTDNAQDLSGDVNVVLDGQISKKCDERIGSERGEPQAADLVGDSERDKTLQRDELIFLSARLLSQCLTTDNRDFLVDEGWLEPVVKLACRLAMIKSGQSHRKLLLGTSKCVLTRQSSTVNAAQAARFKQKNINKNFPKDNNGTNDNHNHDHDNNNSCIEQSDDTNLDNAKTTTTMQPDDLPKEEDQQADLLASIGTEILQHLFKHSEDTCTTIIGMGGLEAILFGCRSSCVETLRHCAPALANLALHGGPTAHELMIEHKAHVWLFPLAFNEDDNVQYYACLAIVTLVANQEIEADVLKSSTLNLVEPFVTSHEPRQFAESNTAHIHGQSASWLRRLIPLLSSKREEARNLASFHLAMEAYVKREQAQSYIFRQIEAIEPLKKLAGSPNAIASKFACQALRLIGEQVPHRLSQQVALWTSEDVIQWVNQVGFAQFEREFADSGVDGDLLLQLDEQMLERDIGIRNGITRRRFLRELSQLKRISDYSSLDRTNLCAILGLENLQYAYAMLKFGVTRDNICHLDAENLLEECGIPNTIHRKILSQTIRNLQDKMALQAQAAAELAQSGQTPSSPQKTLDVFVSYRRSTGSQLASLLKVHLQLRNFSVFIDVERLEAGKFDNNLLDSIKQARNFILVLSPNALDRCIDDFECKDWVHKEIVAALSSDCNIIPIMDNFSFPDPEKLPEDMRSILYYNGVPWIHDYQDACVDKIERFIRGEVNKAIDGYPINNLMSASSAASTAGPIANSTSSLALGSNINSNNQTNSSQQSNCGSLKRHFNQYALSPTPSSLGNPITPIMSQQQQYQQQYSDYSHPLASAINNQQNYMNYVNCMNSNSCQQQQSNCQPTSNQQQQQQLTNFHNGNKR